MGHLSTKIFNKALFIIFVVTLEIMRQTWISFRHPKSNCRSYTFSFSFPCTCLIRQPMQHLSSKESLEWPVFTFNGSENRYRFSSGCILKWNPWNKCLRSSVYVRNFVYCCSVGTYRLCCKFFENSTFGLFFFRCTTFSGIFSWWNKETRGDAVNTYDFHFDLFFVKIS